jgi:hypothetical protein
MGIDQFVLGYSILGRKRNYLFLMDFSNLNDNLLKNILLVFGEEIEFDTVSNWI